MTRDHRRPGELVEQARSAEKAGHSAKALGLFDDALSALGEGSGDPLVADVLRWKGTLLRERGETEAAFRCYSKSLDKARLSGSVRAEAHALNCLAIISQRRGENKDAERLYAEAASLAEKVGDTRLLGMIQQNRGVLANMRGDFAAASELYLKSLGAFEMAGDAEPQSWVLNNIGMLHTKTGKFGEAREYFERALALAIQRRDTIVESVVTLNLAERFMRQREQRIGSSTPRCCASWGRFRARSGILGLPDRLGAKQPTSLATMPNNSLLSVGPKSTSP